MPPSCRVSMLPRQVVVPRGASSFRRWPCGLRCRKSIRNRRLLSMEGDPTRPPFRLPCGGREPARHNGTHVVLAAGISANVVALCHMHHHPRTSLAHRYECRNGSRQLQRQHASRWVPTRRSDAFSAPPSDPSEQLCVACKRRQMKTASGRACEHQNPRDSNRTAG